MSKKRTALIVLAVLLMALVATSAYAQGATKQVALVITYPDSTTYTEIVTVAQDATTADVLAAALVPVGIVDAGFGPAICNINDQGCPTDDCFCNPSAFWAYYHLVGNAWESSNVGVGNYTPADRSVEGFAWSGFDDNFNPTVQPPVKTFAEIAQETAPPPAEIPEPITLLLVGSGLVGMAGYVRRKRSAA